MPVSDDDLEGFGPSNVVPLTRASAASVNPQPDAAAKAVQMAPGLGLPASVIGADLETFQQADRGQKAAQAIERNGWISDYVARNPMAAEVSSDDYDNLEKVSKAVQPFTVAGRQGGLLQAAPEFFLHTIPEAASLLTTAEGRQRLVNAFGKFGEQFYQQTLAAPGDFEKQGFNIHDPADLDRALSLGLLVGLGKQSPKVEAFPRVGRSTPGEVDAFLHQAEGFKTRQEIDEFLAGKAAPGKDPKQVLQIEMAKADSAKLDDAIAATEGSKTKARSPQMLEDFIAGHDTDNIHLPAEAVADLYRAEGKVPAEGDGLFGFVPGLSRDLALGVETGAEITIPASKYIAHVGPAVHEKIKDLIRFRPEGLTVAETQEIKAEETGNKVQVQKNEKGTFDLLDEQGNSLGNLRIVENQGGRNLFVGNVEVAGGPNSLGPSVIKEIGYQLKELFPAAETISGFRISGARDKTARAKVPLRARPEGLTPEEAKMAPEALTVYHGSPHTFDAFDISKIGTGEGAQSYGHGLYLAENPAVASEYKNTNLFRRLMDSPEIQALPQEARIDAVYKLMDEQLKSGGNLYKVSISANREHFLDWDKPLSEQSEHVKKVFEELMPQANLSGWNAISATRGDAKGSDIYRVLLAAASEPMDGLRLDEQISQRLSKAGIPGIKYLDQGSRGEGKGTSNFVVFDPKSVTILERNGERLRNEAMQEETELGLRPLFSEPPPEMTKPEFERYNRRVKDAQQAILDKATKRVEAEKDARLTKEWKAQEAAVREEMSGAVAARPDVATESFLKKGKLKLDEAVIDALAPDNSIPAALKGSGGAHPDDIAPFVGYESGAELVKGLNDLISDRKARNESPTKQLERLINEATSAAMEARHGDFGRQIAEEARALALDDIHFDLLSDELRALARQAGGQPPLSKDALKEWVSGQFSSLDTKAAADFGRWQKAAGREGRKAEQALLKGDAVEAFKAKQRQVLSWLMAKEANRFAKDISKIAAKIDRVQGAKEIASMDQEHFDQLRSMLASAGFGPKHPIPQGLRPLADFVASSDGQLAVASWLTDGSSHPADPSKLTTQEMRDLGKSIDSMMHVGRAVKTLDSARGKAELQNVVFDIKAELDRFDLINQPLNPSVGQRAKSLVRWVNAWSLLVERMLDYTDKFDPNGPLTIYLDRPLRDANVKEIQLNEKATRHLQKLAKLTDNSINDVIPNSVIPSELNESGFLDMNRRNLRQLMGYMGSESGIKKVVEGFNGKPQKEIVGEKDGKPVYRQTAQSNSSNVKFVSDVWKLINDNATKADWQWVAGMHELFEDLWKESAAMQERDTGVAADPIKPLKMTSEKHGDFPGGYWPIKYDKMRSNIEGHIAAKSDLFDKHYVQAVTPQAYTEARTQFAAPLDLSGQLIGSHIRGMIHDIAFREAVRNAAKLINNAEFMAAMTQKWSKEYAGLLPGWIKDIANAQRVDDSYAMGAARWSALVRQNITSTLIALNPGTVIKHGMSALGMSIERVGAKELGSAAVELGTKAMVQSANELIKGKGEPPTQERLDALKAVTDPSEIGNQIRQFIIDSSAVMRNRQRAAADNIREAYQQNIKSGAGQLFVDARSAWMDIGRFPVALSDAVSAMPTWLAAYKEAMTRGEDHTQAVFEADKQVSRAHGSSFIGDRPRIMRTDEVMRWVTPLYNFWNHMQNNYMQWMWDAGAWAKGREEPGANIGSLGRRVFWLAIWSIVAEEIASPALDEDRRSLGQKVFMATLRHFGAGYIGLRDVTNAAAHGYEPSVGLLGTLSKEIAGTGREMARVGAGKELSKNWLIHAFTALGFATGLGGAQLGKTSSYLKDRFTGAERGPKSWAELRQGLRTGHSKARIHK